MSTLAAAPHSVAPRRRALVLAHVIWLVAAAALLIPYFASFSGLLDWSGNILGRDFVNMWTGARAVTAGTVDSLFHNDSFRALQRALFGFPLPPHNWSYPPPLLLFVAPLALLSYPAALALWSAAGLALYLASARGLLSNPWALAALAIAPASLLNLVTGQNGFFTAALFWLGLALLQRRPVAAGVAFGLLALKPQLALLLPVALLMDRRWATLVTAAATVAILAALTAFAFGPQVFTAYVEEALPFQTRVFTETDGIFVRMMPTAFMNARLAGADAATAWLFQAPVSLLGIAIGLWGWRRAGDRLLGAGALLAGTFLASPYLFLYDLTLMGPLVAVLWPRAEKPAEKLTLALLWSLPVSGLVAGLFGLPISALAIVLFAGWLAVEIARAPAPHRPAI